MISQEQIPAVIDHMVYGSDGKKIGEARHVFLDDRSGTPEWATVRTGMFGSQETFVPIHDARLVEDHLEVPYAKTKIKDAPRVHAERGRLSEEQEHELYRYYGVDWDASWKQANDPAAGWVIPGAERGTEPASDTGSGAGFETSGTQTGAEGAETGESRPMRDPGSVGGMEQTGVGGTGTAGMTPGTAQDGAMGGQQADAMTRSEEQMHVRTERQESGRARLHKYVVTEEVQQTVPLHHEEAHIEHEPITEANVRDAVSGQDITEDDYEIVLHADRVVTDKETVPVERVRLVAEDHVEEETVRGEIRKERIEAEGASDESARNPRGGTGAGPADNKFG
jgi:stress response protein YsnF